MTGQSRYVPNVNRAVILHAFVGLVPSARDRSYAALLFQGADGLDHARIAITAELARDLTLGASRFAVFEDLFGEQVIDLGQRLDGNNYGVPRIAIRLLSGLELKAVTVGGKERAYASPQ